MPSLFSALHTLMLHSSTRMVFLTLLAIASVAAGLATPARKLCVVPLSGADDTPAFETMLANCSSNSTILFEKGKTYQLLTPVVAPSLK